MRDIRWGIIGCGAVTEVKSGPGLQKAERSRLVAVMRRNASLAEDYARRHGVPRWYSDARDLLADPEVDAVYVATPPSTHREYARLAAAAGKPVYVEKPMARTHAECLEMIAACREAGVALYVAYYRRAQPRFLKVRDLLAAGAIGAPRSVTVTLHQPPPAPVARPEDLPWRVRPEISGGGLFVDLGSHTLDLRTISSAPSPGPPARGRTSAGCTRRRTRWPAPGGTPAAPTERPCTGQAPGVSSQGSRRTAWRSPAAPAASPLPPLPTYPSSWRPPRGSRSSPSPSPSTSSSPSSRRWSTTSWASECALRRANPARGPPG